MSPGDATLTALCSKVRDFIREPRAAAFEPLALELFAWQFRQNRAYRAFCERSGRTPESVQSWTDIPALPTSAFKELELTTIASADRVAVFHSSGTTQHRPSRHYHSRETLDLYEDSLCAWFK